MTESLAAVVGRDLADELSTAHSMIEHCLGQLTDDQVWWRPRDDMNSIGNLLLHLSGNVRQWIVSGVGGAADHRQRQAEFDERGPIPKAEVLAQLRGTVGEALAVLAAADEANWLRVRTVQLRDVSGAAAAIHSVSHFCGHAQEIVHMTRSLLGSDYIYKGRPAQPRL